MPTKTPKKITLDGSLKIQDEIWAAIEENHIKIFGIKGASDIFYENIMSPHILKKFKKFGFSFDILIKIKFAQGVYAEISALFIIEPSGEDVKVTKPEAEPRIW